MRNPSHGPVRVKGGVPGSTFSGSLGLPARKLLFHFTDIENMGFIIAAANGFRKADYGPHF
jgi:hypothetical protein